MGRASNLQSLLPWYYRGAARAVVHTCHLHCPYLALPLPLSRTRPGSPCAPSLALQFAPDATDNRTQHTTPTATTHRMDEKQIEEIESTITKLVSKPCSEKTTLRAPPPQALHRARMEACALRSPSDHPLPLCLLGCSSHLAKRLRPHGPKRQPRQRARTRDHSPLPEACPRVRPRDKPPPEAPHPLQMRMT